MNMLQEDSNGETSFEIIDKKNGDTPATGCNTESLSSVSSTYSIPSPSVMTLPGATLLTSVASPTALPNVTLWQPQAIPAPSPLPPNLIQPKEEDKPPAIVNIQPFPQTQFSAAIPPSKGVQHAPPLREPSVESSGGPSGGLIGWMRDAVSSGGILSKVAEKAKNSVDSIITTLDPQMTEFIYSGGDMEFVIASQDVEEISSIREAIFSVFGKAWVNTKIKVEEKKHQAVGFEEGLTRAEEKLGPVLQANKMPAIAIESVLLKQNEQWFDLSVLLLKDSQKQITVHTFTQSTPIPVDQFLRAAEKEMPVYSKECNSTEKLLSAYLQILPNTWQQTISGVSRRESVFLAAKSLISFYKTRLLNQ